MDENSVYPTIRVTLHQKFTAKDYTLENDSNPQTYDWIYQKYLTRDDNNNLSCTFGGKAGENFRVYAPNGEKFQYSVVEELIPYQGDPIALTNNGDSGLGFTYECTGIHYSDLSPNGATAQSGYVEEEATITNTYHPQDDNFKGLVIVNKNWNFNDENNAYNRTEFSRENDYKFTLKRKTRKISGSDVVTVNTYCVKGTSLPTVDWDSSIQPYISSEMAAYDENNNKLTLPTENVDSIKY